MLHKFSNCSKEMGSGVPWVGLLGLASFSLPGIKNPTLVVVDVLGFGCVGTGVVLLGHVKVRCPTSPQIQQAGRRPATTTGNFSSPASR